MDRCPAAADDMCGCGVVGERPLPRGQQRSEHAPRATGLSAERKFGDFFASDVSGGALRAWRGLRDETASYDENATVLQTKKTSRRTGIRGETHAYWYLRRLGYVLVAHDDMPRRVKCEIDMIGYDRKTLAFVEVRTRTVRKEFTALPELSVTREKQELLARTAKLFLLERRVALCPSRFDVVAIDNEIGAPPVVRLHKDAFSPQ